MALRSSSLSLSLSCLITKSHLEKKKIWDRFAAQKWNLDLACGRLALIFCRWSKACFAASCSASFFLLNASATEFLQVVKVKLIMPQWNIVNLCHKHRQSNMQKNSAMQDWPRLATCQKRDALPVKVPTAQPSTLRIRVTTNPHLSSSGLSGHHCD